MHRFEIWAPLPRKVAVCVNGRARPMKGPDPRGRWYLDVEDAGPRSDYCFLLDDEQTCYPDPRSQWQPKGVHGPSRVYDQAEFKWADSPSSTLEFQAVQLPSAVLYELHVGTFTAEGTLDSAIGKLDHLVELGVTHVELMPVASFPGHHGWGYDGVDLFSVHEPYGGPDALKRFVNAAHNNGLAVLLDVVYNHFGPDGNYTGKFAPYLVDAHRTPWGDAVNFEGSDSDQVRRFFCDNALMWLREYHIDGLRLDAVHAFVDRSAIPFLEQLSTEVEILGNTLGKKLIVIAESDLNDPRLVTPRETGGMGLDAQWSDDFHHALFTALQREPVAGYYADFGTLSQLKKALEKSFVYDGIYSAFRKRVHGRPATHVPQYRFLGYIQNHDQVGNRAIGERLPEVVGFERAKMAAAIVFVAPFVPMIFQGEEWAASTPFQYFADHEDAELARLVSEGRKREFAVFGWNPALVPNPEKRETFERSKLQWDELREGEHAEMLSWYGALIRLRRSTPALNNYEPGHTCVEHDDKNMTLTIQRGDIKLFCNLGESGCMVSLPDGSKLLLSSLDLMRQTNGEIELPPAAAAIFRIS